VAQNNAFESKHRDCCGLLFGIFRGDAPNPVFAFFRYARSQHESRLKLINFSIAARSEE
jgi:hypothetical protein